MPKEIRKPPKAKLLGSSKIHSDVVRLSTQDLKPSFSFEHLQRGYCISDCTPEEKAALADRLREISQLTWAQIQGAGRHGLGCETIDRDSISGNKSFIPEDAKILSFRFAGMKPMVGFRQDKMFSVAWLDRDFTLYKH